MPVHMQGDDRLYSRGDRSSIFLLTSKGKKRFLLIQVYFYSQIFRGEAHMKKICIMVDWMNTSHSVYDFLQKAN